MINKNDTGTDKVYFNNNNVQAINYVNPVENKNLIKVVGETKHVIPASKEWKNSVYYYNTDKSILSKHKLLNKFLQSYFATESFFKLRDKLKYIVPRSRSIRKKMLASNKSIDQILLSKPEIKQTNDKVIVTLYTYNRRKEHLMRKIYLSNEILGRKNIIKYISSPNLHSTENLYLDKKSDKQLLKINNNYLYNENIDIMLNNRYRKDMLSKYINLKVKTKLKKSSLNRLTNTANNKFKSKYIKYVNFYKLGSNYRNYLNKISFYKGKFIISLIKKRFYLKTIFFFGFLRWILSLIKIKVYLLNSNNTGRRKRKLLVIKSINSNKRFIIKNSLLINLKNINNLLFHILIVSLNNKNLNIVFSLFKLFKQKFFKKYVAKYLKKDQLIIDNLYMFSFNNFKFQGLLSTFKVMINKIYNKKVFFNIVNLKQLYLNNDILVKSIALKLKRKKGKLLRTLKKSIRLVKLANKKSNILNMSSRLLHNYKDDKLNSFNHDLYKRDTVNQTLYNIFKYEDFYVKNSKENMNDVKNERTNILNSINYKWIKGIKLEAKGRLTRRYTASKSVYKYMYRGNLENKNNISQTMLRGDLKSNLQYGFIASKKRIGAFGIKGWVSTL